jgi:hypothetical protein
VLILEPMMMRRERHVLTGVERMCISDASGDRRSCQKLMSRSTVMNQKQPVDVAAISSSRVGPTTPMY